MLLASFPMLTLVNVQRVNAIKIKESITAKAVVVSDPEQTQIVIGEEQFELLDGSVMVLKEVQQSAVLDEVSELEAKAVINEVEIVEEQEQTQDEEDNVTEESFEEPISIDISNEHLEPLFENYSSQYGVSKHVLKTIAYCESGNRASAINGPYAGMFQFTSGTWVSNRKAMGLEHSPDLRFDANESIKTAAFKIARDGVGAWPVCGKRALASTSI